jgi:hypothetical protein
MAKRFICEMIGASKAAVADRPPAAGLNSGRTRPLWILCAFKAVYLIIIAGTILIWPAGRDSELARYSRIHWTPAGHPEFTSYFTTWDVGHYLYLSQEGYHAGTNSCAFYPLWPLALRWSSRAFGGEQIITGTLLANVLSVAGWFLFFKLVARGSGDAIAWRSLILLLAFPGSIFFQFMYSESLFFLLLMLLCLGLERSRPWLIAGSSFLLPLARPLGIFCVLPIGLFLLDGFCRSIQREPSAPADRAERWQGLMSFAQRMRQSLAASHNLKRLWWLMVPPLLGWAAYFTLMWKWTGNPFEGFAAQRFWGVQSIGNLFNVPAFVIALFTPTTWHAFTGSFLDRAGFVLLLYTLPVIWGLGRDYFAWAIVLGVVPAMSGHFTSFIRFESVVFPMFIALGAWLSRPRRRWLWLCCLGLFVLLHGVLLWRLIYFRWAG